MQPLKVIIKEREFDYQPDYPNDWKFSAGDPFKFPVSIGDYRCFIKRFGADSPKKVSGWQMLMKLRGKYEKNLSRVYDIKRMEGDDEEIYYAFYEFLEGTTLDKYINNPDLDLKHLTNDLINSIRLLQRYEFWFADFTEKNIFCEKNGIFALIDLDSAYPLATPPDNEMYGSKDYWILVLTYYKKFLNKNNIRLTDINGINLNYLQIPFLILRLKLFRSGKKKDYNAPELFNSLPSTLNEMAPEITEIFTQVISNGREPLAQTDISKIEEIIENKIIGNMDIREIMVQPDNLPLIRSFSASTDKIENGGSFTLNWQIENTDRLELYKNGARFKTLAIDQKNIMLTDFADGTRLQSSYQLNAYKDLAIAKSDTVIIESKKKPTTSKPRVSQVSPRPRKRIFIVLGILVIALAAFFLFKQFSHKNYEIRIGADRLYEGTYFTIYGKELPGRNSLNVLFDNIAGEIKNYSADSVEVSVPKLTNMAEGTVVEMAVDEGDKTIFLMPLPLRYQIINLFDSASKALWKRSINELGGNTINADFDDPQTSWPGNINDNHGYALSGSFTMEDSKEYQVLWTHPWWNTNGTIRGEFPLCNLPGKKHSKRK